MTEAIQEYVSDWIHPSMPVPEAPVPRREALLALPSRQSSAPLHRLCNPSPKPRQGSAPHQRARSAFAKRQLPNASSRSSGSGGPGSRQSSAMLPPVPDRPWPQSLRPGALDAGAFFPAGPSSPTTASESRTSSVSTRPAADPRQRKVGLLEPGSQDAASTTTGPPGDPAPAGPLQPHPPHSVLRSPAAIHDVPERRDEGSERSIGPLRPPPVSGRTRAHLLDIPVSQAAPRAVRIKNIVRRLQLGTDSQFEPDPASVLPPPSLTSPRAPRRMPGLNPLQTLASPLPHIRVSPPPPRAAGPPSGFAPAAPAAATGNPLSPRRPRGHGRLWQDHADLAVPLGPRSESVGDDLSSQGPPEPRPEE